MVPPFTGEINPDLVKHIFDLTTLVEQCKSDRRLLREWVEKKTATQGKTDNE